MSQELELKFPDKTRLDKNKTFQKTRNLVFATYGVIAGIIILFNYVGIVAITKTGDDLAGWTSTLISISITIFMTIVVYWITKDAQIKTDSLIEDLTTITTNVEDVTKKQKLLPLMLKVSQKIQKKLLKIS